MSYVIKIPPYTKGGVIAEILQVAQSMGIFPQETPIHPLYTNHPKRRGGYEYLGIRESTLGAVNGLCSGDIMLDITEVLKDE